MSSAKILVTGASGFIGTHLVESLVHAGADLRVLHFRERWQPDHLHALPGTLQQAFETVEGSICDRDVVRQAVKGCGLIYHLAAETREASTQVLMETHVTGTLNLMHAALEADARVVLASTYEVYGTPLYQPVDEKHPLQGHSVMGASRLAGETLAESFRRTFKLPLSIARLFEVYGPRQSPTHMLSELLQRFLAAEAGSTFLCPEQSLSAIYVSDAVDALRRCGEDPAALGQTLNFGSDSRIDSIQLLSLLMTSQGKDLQLASEQSFYAVPFPSCDARRAEKKLGWRPRTDWPEGLQATLSWLAGQGA